MNIPGDNLTIPCTTHPPLRHIPSYSQISLGPDKPFEKRAPCRALNGSSNSATTPYDTERLGYHLATTSFDGWLRRAYDAV